ncbi:MAG TPA: hypothetical protein DHN33_09845 [Eubacteriaceae bacterium]|nr:hypothetical protein [Eubacteriaceae bacterium]
MRFGEGFQLQIITVVFFVIGATVGAKTSDFWQQMPILSKDGMFLPDFVGWLPAIALQMIAFYGLFRLIQWWGVRNE